MTRSRSRFALALAAPLLWVQVGAAATHPAASLSAGPFLEAEGEEEVFPSATATPTSTATAIGSSVYDVRPAVDLSIIAGAVTAVVVPALLQNQLIRPRCPCNPAEVNGLDRPAIGNASDAADVVSTATAAAAVAVPPALDLLDVGVGRALGEDLVVFAEALAVNGAFVQAAKYIVQRPLPRTYAGDPSLVGSPRGYRSFYSGHTSLTVAALSTASVTYALRHGASAWPWIATGVVGASVAVERVAAGRHFPTDVAVGALAGAAVGIAVPYLHERRRSGGPDVELSPGPGQAGLGLSGQF